MILSTILETVILVLSCGLFHITRGSWSLLFAVIISYFVSNFMTWYEDSELELRARDGLLDVPGTPKYNMNACKLGLLDTIKSISKQDAAHKDSQGCTYLMMACKHDRLESAQYLLKELNCHINEQD